MATKGNEPITPCMYTKIGDGENDYQPLKDGQKTGWEIKFGGLTKREHMAIEFTKAVLSNNEGIYNFRSEETEVKFCTRIGIKVADELIKQLNS